MALLKYLALVQLLVKVVSGEVTTPPNNTVVEVGGSVTLNCKSSTTSPVPSWVFYREKETGTATAVIAENCQVAANFTTQYRTTSGAGGSECNLIILSATLDQGGIYFCVIGLSERKAALLTVVDVKLSMNNRSEIVEGDDLNVSCSVWRSTTQAPQQPLNLNWNDTVGPNIRDSVNNSSVSSGIVTAKRKDFPSYMCSISFGALKSTSEFYATNIPSTISKSSSATGVQYCPSVPEVSRSGNPDRLICRAEANPPPSYSWVDENGNMFLDAELKLNHSGTYTYTCNATTTIRGRVCYNTTDYNVTVTITTSPPTTTTIPTTSTTRSSSGTTGTGGQKRNLDVE